MASRITQLADSIKDLLVSQVPSDIVVKRVYTVTKRIEELTGKNLWIFPLNYSDQGPADRSESYLDSSIGLVYSEKYVLPGVVPDEWVDDRTEFVETGIFDILNDNVAPYGPNGEYWAQTATVSTLYDVDALRQFKMFWAELEFTYRRVL